MDILSYVGGGSSLASFGAGWSLGFLLILVWSIFWKGLALWATARKGEKIWFLVFLVVNTIGILEIIYLFVVTKEGKPILNSILDKVRGKKLV